MIDKKIKPGHLVEITFLDHCSRHAEGKTPLQSRAFGILIEETKKCYAIATWIEVDGTLDNNTEMFTIVKGAVTKIRRLK